MYKYHTYARNIIYSTVHMCIICVIYIIIYIYTWYNMYPTATCNSDGWDVPRDLTVIILCGLSCITLPFLREISGTLRILGFAPGNVAGNEKMSGVAGLEQFFEMFGDQDMWNLLHTKCEQIYLVSICWCCKATNITLQVVVLRLYVPSPKMRGLSPTKYYQWNIIKGWLNHQSTSRQVNEAAFWYALFSLASVWCLSSHLCTTTRRSNLKGFSWTRSQCSGIEFSSGWVTCWLAGRFKHVFIFHHIWDNPSHCLSYFSEGLKPPTSVGWWFVPGSHQYLGEHHNPWESPGKTHCYFSPNPWDTHGTPNTITYNPLYCNPLYSIVIHYIPL